METNPCCGWRHVIWGTRRRAVGRAAWRRQVVAVSDDDSAALAKAMWTNRYWRTPMRSRLAALDHAAIDVCCVVMRITSATINCSLAERNIHIVTKAARDFARKADRIRAAKSKCRLTMPLTMRA